MAGPKWRQPPTNRGLLEGFGGEPEHCPKPSSSECDVLGGRLASEPKQSFSPAAGREELCTSSVAQGSPPRHQVRRPTVILEPAGRRIHGVPSLHPSPLI